MEFSQIVNSGENDAKAVLTANIDMSGKTWTPIGDDDHRFVGTFDGQYHVIDHLVFEGTDKVGIFGVVSGGCFIKNLTAGPNNVMKGNSMVGGIIGCSAGSEWVTLCQKEGLMAPTERKIRIGYVHGGKVKYSHWKTGNEITISL